MPLTIDIRPDTGQGQEDATRRGSGHTLALVAVGGEDEAEVRDAVRLYLPAYVGHLPYRSFRLERKGLDVWHADAEYGYGGKATKVTFGTTGGTTHVTQGLGTVRRYSVGADNLTADIPEFKGAIGVNGETVEGADVGVSELNFKEEHQIAYTTLVDPAFINAIAALTFTVNDSTFRGFQRGEVLFKGLDGEYEACIVPDPDPDLLYPVTFTFAAARNRTDIVLGPAMGDEAGAVVDGIEKEGWQYLWVRYKDKVDSKMLTKQPQFVYVEKIYEYGDFSNLQIGT